MAVMIGWGRPAMTWSGLAFVDDPSVLTNSQPGAVARFTWPGVVGGDPVTFVTGTFTFGESIVPGMVGLLNTTLPVGTMVAVTLGGNTYTQAVQALPRGERVCWFVLPAGLAAITGGSVKLTATVPNASLQDIGEWWVSPATKQDIIKDWGTDSDDPTTTATSDTFQAFVQRQTPRRIRNFTPADMRIEGLYGSSAGGAMDFETLWSKMDRGQTVVIIPRWQEADGTYSPYLANRTAVFGLASKAPGSKHLAGHWFSASEISIKEIPIPV